MRNRLLPALLAVAFVSAPLPAQVTSRISVSSTGVQGDGDSHFPIVSPDGRFVAYQSGATTLVPADTNGVRDAFLFDRVTGITERISIATDGTQGTGDSGAAAVTPDGRLVTFWSTSTNLVPGDTNATSDVFLRDRLLGTTERVSIGNGGIQGNGMSDISAISDDGRFVAFATRATNFFTGDFNASPDVFVRDRQNGTTELISVSLSGTTGSLDSNWPAMSADGRFVAFYGNSTNLVAGYTLTNAEVFIRDRLNGTTELIDFSNAGTLGNHGASNASLSSDGRYVAFFSSSSNLVAGDTNFVPDIFLRDRVAGTTERVSVASDGTQADARSERPWISRDGRHVAFHSEASNLVPGDSNARTDAFVRDCDTQVTERVSVSSAGLQGNEDSGYYVAALSENGRFVAFESRAGNLVPGDTNFYWDIFVRDRNSSGFATLCDPGIANVIACPCSNPPSGSGRGCDNSYGTGGAALMASGTAYLSVDSLVFTTSGEGPSAASIVMQGNGVIPGGAILGQGVRCLGGTIIRRLFIKNAVGGSIVAPDFSAGDPTVSAQSAAKGFPIVAGETLWYLVYYRDPISLGGCAAGNTFNSTQTGSVTWWP